MSRRAARVDAVEVLYGSSVRCVDADQVLNERADTDPYTKRLVAEVVRRHDELDRLVRDNAERWAPERMSPVDHSILQVGVLELLEAEVPPAVAIDEAVEIAKHFSGEQAGRFVNGVLGAVLAHLQAGGDSEGGDSGGGSEGAGGAGGVTG
ncbi:MAG: transcription antitermination factor NusB [Actinomycetota bacterium]